MACLEKDWRKRIKIEDILSQVWLFADTQQKEEKKKEMTKNKVEKSKKITEKLLPKTYKLKEKKEE